MEKLINTKLKEIEAKYDVKILLAVESGSRAWGFASPDSDYDVRFIYVHRPTWYGTIFPGKDTIEIMDKENNLDFSGWDLRKALGLLYKGNPPLLEWLKSPIVYQSMPEAVSELKTLSSGYYDVKSAIYHYIHMAYGNWKSYINDRNPVLTKKYLYIIRPLLACKWVEVHGTFPPMEIAKTLKLLDYSSDIAEAFDIPAIIEKKKAGGELGMDQPNLNLNRWILQYMGYYEKYVKTLDHVKKDTIPLDKYLFKWMKEAWD